MKHGMTVSAQFAGVAFEGRLLKVDAPGGSIFLSTDKNEEATRALLQRPRCSFRSRTPGRHVEFSAAGPRRVIHAGTPAIELKFPDVMASHQERAHPRAAVAPHAPLSCLADAGGITPFDARMIDIGRGGVGFLVYPSDITLAPGTLLRGCRIQGPDGRTLVADLEVRYSRPVKLADGTRAVRSGCRFVDPSPEVMELVRHYLAE